MNGIEKFHQISENALDQRDYFSSLCDNALSLGIFSQNDMQKIQNELYVILAEKADSFTGGKSSSVRAERAEDLLFSIVFVIGLCLKRFDTPDNAVYALKNSSLKSLFEEGMTAVKQKMVISARLQKRICSDMLPTPNIYYRCTLADGINGFFRLYRPQFAAHEIHITADYPPFLGRPGLLGVEFIEQYLRFMEAENAFCRLFPPEDIHRLLLGLRKDYAETPLNIFEPVFLSALALVLLGRPPLALDLLESDIAVLDDIFTGKSTAQIREILTATFGELGKSVRLPLRFESYAPLCMPKLAEIVENAASIGKLNRTFLVPRRI